MGDVGARAFCASRGACSGEGACVRCSVAGQVLSGWPLLLQRMPPRVGRALCVRRPLAIEPGPAKRSCGKAGLRGAGVRPPAAVACLVAGWPSHVFLWRLRPCRVAPRVRSTARPSPSHSMLRLHECLRGFGSGWAVDVVSASLVGSKSSSALVFVLVSPGFLCLGCLTPLAIGIALLRCCVVLDHCATTAHRLTIFHSSLDGVPSLQSETTPYKSSRPTQFVHLRIWA